MDKFTVSTHYAGTVENTTVVFDVEQNCVLLHVSAVVSTSAVPTIRIAGSTAGTVLSTSNVGASNVPQEWAFEDFDTYAASRSFPRFVKGETITVTVTKGEGEPSDLTLALTFLDE